MPELLVPARLEHLAAVNTFLAENIPSSFQPLLPNLELVAEELLVNVFSYAYPEGSVGKAEVVLQETSLDGRPALCFTVKDWGLPFDPFEEAPIPDLTLDTESRPIGGLGVYLIRNVTDRQCYQREDDANRIDVFFRLPETE